MLVSRAKTYNNLLVDNVDTAVVVLGQEPRGKTSDNDRGDENHQVVGKGDVSQGGVLQSAEHFDKINGLCLGYK